MYITANIIVFADDINLLNCMFKFLIMLQAYGVSFSVEIWTMKHWGVTDFFSFFLGGEG